MVILAQNIDWEISFKLSAIPETTACENFIIFMYIRKKSGIYPTMVFNLEITIMYCDILRIVLFTNMTLIVFCYPMSLIFFSG